MKDWLEFVPFEAGIVAVFLLRMAWKNANAWRPWLIVGGWSLIAVAIGVGWYLLGPVRGVFIALTAIMLAGLFTVAIRFQLRPAKVVAGRDVALEPSDRKRLMWRGWLRGLLAGPMSGIAALGVGLMWAICMPGAPQTRMVIGGLLVPVLWAGGMAWTLSDDKIVRAFLVLLGVALVSLGAAFLKGSLV